MYEQEELQQPMSVIEWIGATIARVSISALIPFGTFFILWLGFMFLRYLEASQFVIALVAMVWGIIGVAPLFAFFNWLVERLPAVWTFRLRPYVFVGPALAILSWFLLLPTLRSLYYSFFNASSDKFVGLANYVYTFTDSTMLTAYRNNLLWLVFGTSFSVGFGLLIAILADRSKFETVAKSVIFLPMAISLIGAGLIWKFVYAFRPEGAEQIGILNAILALFDIAPQAWFLLRPWNNFLLIAILVWLQTGYSMVLLSAAIKQVPVELLEAGRIDGANEIQAFFKIIIPNIQGTLVMVSTTVLIMTLKVFDIVYSLTSGNYGTEVIASMQIKQMFKFQDYGRGSAIAIVLLLAVSPVMWYNLRQFFTKREVFK